MLVLCIGAAKSLQHLAAEASEKVLENHLRLVGLRRNRCNQRLTTYQVLLGSPQKGK